MARARILIVEDEAIIALDEKETLEGMGYEIVGVVDSGESALVAAEKLSPDLVIMDITLKSAMTGVEAAWELRKHFDTHVIFVTSKGNKAIYDSANSDQITGYIIKPFDPIKLEATIEAALRGELESPHAWHPLGDS